MFWLELRKLRWRLALASFLLAWPVVQDVSGLDLAPNGNRADKSGYTLWNPTPASLMRELSADRPDKTDSAYTVDAGHYQLEIDLVNWTLDRHNPEGRNVRLSVTEIAAANIKLGILNQLDV